jgi:hypothetical protein
MKDIDLHQDTEAESSVAQIALRISGQLGIANNHHRSLVNTDFSSTCQELRLIFHNRCNCGIEDQQKSDRVDCSYDGLSAVARFNEDDFTLSRLEVCRTSANACISLQYANQMTLFCEATSHDQACESCDLCQPNVTNSAGNGGLLGLSVNCTDSPILSTNGVCEITSHVLDLGVRDPILSKVAIAAVVLSSLCVMFAVARWLKCRSRRENNIGQDKAVYMEDLEQFDGSEEQMSVI